MEQQKPKGGPGTREDPANPSHKSALDLVIVSSELEEHIDEMVIDNLRKFTPFKRHSNGKLSYSDHFGISVTLKNLPHHSSINKFQKKFTRWNTNTQNGWNIFKDLTTNNEKLEQIANSPSTDPDELMRKISRELDAVRYKAFGRVKVKTKTEEDKLSKLLKEKEELIDRNECIDEVDERICDEIQEKQRSEMSKELDKLYDLKRNKGNAAAVFELKEKVLGKKKGVEGPTAITNPITNETTFNPKEILKICADYCVNLLKNREPSESFKEDVDMKRVIHNIRMKERIENDIEFSEEVFKETLKTFKKKNGNKYDLIVKSGPSLHAALIKLYKVVWNGEVKPGVWRDTVIVQIDKGKAKANKANLE